MKMYLLHRKNRTTMKNLLCAIVKFVNSVVSVLKDEKRSNFVMCYMFQKCRNAFNNFISFKFYCVLISVSKLNHLNGLKQ